MLMVVGLFPTGAVAADPPTLPYGTPDPNDPRVGLGAGFDDAEIVSWNIERIGRFDKRDGIFFDPNAIGSISWANSDISFTGNYVIAGNFSGFQIHDISDPTNPTPVTQVLCPGGQGDTNVYGDLLFLSVEETRGRIDCGTTPPTSAERFRGVRIFDISDIRNPVQVAAVQTCRGSHTNRLVEDPNDPEHVYIYVQGTSSVRSGTELEGCANPSKSSPDFNETSSRYRIEVIKVPLARPEDSAVVNEVRLFADEETGRIDGLWPGGNHGPGTQSTSETDACHDITAFPAIGLAAGACEGNGILIDISDPANPKRIDVVSDPNYAYWHTANFSNDGTKIVFTDEWGGGTQARCRASDPLSWGADSVYDIVQTEDGPKMEFRSHWKMPAVQTSSENCVAHQLNILPIPNRDVFVQGWYQGGISLVDFTDSENPFEMGYWDQGPIDASRLTLGGFWSAYWYNGHVYGPEIARGFDVFDLQPSEFLTQNEIDAAKEVQQEYHNAMAWVPYEWDATFALARATVDQIVRDDDMTEGMEGKIRNALDMAEQFLAMPKKHNVALSHFDRAVHLLLWQADVIEGKDKPNQGDAERLRALADTISELKANS